MQFKFLLAAAACGLATTAANAAVTVIGSSMARSCYEAADAKRVLLTNDLETCDRALSEEALSEADAVATLVNRGILLARRGDTQAALADFDAATARDPSQPEPYFNKAAVLLRAGSADRALPLFSAAIDRKTRFLAGAYFGRAAAQEDLGNVKAAYLDYRRASQADPKWAEPKAELARFSVRR